MFPAPFTYHRPKTVEEALTVLEKNEDATVLAGGHALLPDLKQRTKSPTVVVDISELPELQGITQHDDVTTIGAATTYSALLSASPSLQTDLPAVIEATKVLGDRQIRNRGTVGGNVAEAHPESDLPAALLACDSILHLEGPTGERTMPISKFISGPHSTQINDPEIITAIDVPNLGTNTSQDGFTAGTYLKKTHHASGYAMVGVAIRISIQNTQINSVKIGVTGVTKIPTRLSHVENSLIGQDILDLDSRDTITDVVQNIPEEMPSSNRWGDIHASEHYRMDVLPSMVDNAITSVLDEYITLQSKDDSSVGNSGGAA